MFWNCNVLVGQCINALRDGKPPPDIQLLAPPAGEVQLLRSSVDTANRPNQPVYRVCLSDYRGGSLLEAQPLCL